MPKAAAATEALRRGSNLHGEMLGEDALVVVGWGMGWWDAREWRA